MFCSAFISSSMLCSWQNRQEKSQPSTAWPAYSFNNRLGQISHFFWSRLPFEGKTLLKVERGRERAILQYIHRFIVKHVMHYHDYPPINIHGSFSASSIWSSCWGNALRFSKLLPHHHARITENKAKQGSLTAAFSVYEGFQWPIL